MKDDNPEQKIVDFVNGQMDETERNAFEQQLATNEDLRSEVKFYREVAQTTQTMEDDELRQFIGQTDQELAGEGFFEARPAAKVRRILPVRQVFAIAAAVAMLLVAGWWWANSNYSNQALAERHFDAQVTQKMVRSEGGTEGPLSRGVKSLSDGKLAEAIVFFETVPDSSAYYLESRLYLALAHYQSADFKAAHDIANEVSTSTSRFQQKARWLQLNSLLRVDETDTTFRTLLDAAVDDGTDPYYQKKAVEMKSEVDGFWWKLVN